MDRLPLASVTAITAVQIEDRMILTVVGEVSGFGGSLEIEQSNTRIHPPRFFVYHRPGNCGITGDCLTRPSIESRVFRGHFYTIDVITADGPRRMKVASAREPTLQPGPAPMVGAPVHPAIVSGVGVPNEPVDDEEWHAWINMQPGAVRDLHVKGEVVLPTPGYRVLLRRSEEQGPNPQVLLLELDITKLDGSWSQVISRLPVQFDESPASNLYTSVHVRGTDISIPVQLAW
jgi:hypothetical protein